jgi:membrane protein
VNIAKIWKNFVASVLRLPLVQILLDWWQALPASTRTLPAHLWTAIMNFKNHGMKNAAALAYYAVFSVFPLALLLAVGISAILGPAVAQEQIYEGLKLFLPEETDTLTLFQESLGQALEQGTGFGLFALVGLVWSALGLFSNLTSSIDRIFQVPASRNLFTERLLAFFMTLGLIVLIATSFITSGLLSLMDAFLLSSPSIWIRIGVLFLPLGLNLVIFILLFRYVPSRHVNWDAVWPAAILGAFVLEIAKTLFGSYLAGLANYQFVYGSIATVIILMVWAYLVASVFLICAEICSQLNFWLITHEEHERRTVAAFLDIQLEGLPEEVPPPL